MGQETDVLERDANVLSDAMKIRFFPFVMQSQNDSRLQGIDGESAIDFSASWAVANTGYRHPTVVEQVKDQLEITIANSPISIAHEPVVELAERLRELTAFPFQTKVWFGHSGSEAGDFIAKALPTAAKGDTIITFEGSYHGITVGAATISGHTAQQGIRADSVEVLPFPQGTQSTAILDEVESLFETSNVAGVITEPIQSDGGILVPPADFLPGLAALCTDHDAYLVIDEVKAGLGRTGTMFAYEHSGVVPDAIMLGKPLGSGVPISAVVGREDLLDYQSASHMMTTAGGPLPTAAGLATLDVLAEEQLPEEAARKGTVLRALLSDLAADFSVIGEIRGRGLLQGVEITEEDGTAPNAELAAKISFWARKHDLIVFYVGMESNVLEITPPLTISAAELEEGCKRLRAAIEDAQTQDLDDEIWKQYAGW
jgi:4-aminobutyrate aminotransferase